MTVTVTASTGRTVVVWLEQEAFYARLKGKAQDPQVCLGVDLFEVIADLTGLDLEDAGQAVEAIRLADEARERLEHVAERPGHGRGEESDEARRRCS